MKHLADGCRPGGCRSVIRGRDLKFRWRPDGPLIIDLPRLELGRGQRLFISGPSGSGKSTLLGLLAGVNVSSHGELEVLGSSLAALSGPGRDRFRADHIGYIFQLFNLLPYLSVVENVILPCRFSPRRRQKAGGDRRAVRAEALRLLERLDLHDPALLTQPVTELSVGQQQRVAAARALIGNPELIIADEPTSSLDQDRRESFITLLFQECAHQEASLVFVSHDQTLAHLFDQRLDLAAGGRVPAADAPAVSNG